MWLRVVEPFEARGVGGVAGTQAGKGEVGVTGSERPSGDGLDGAED